MESLLLLGNDLEDLIEVIANQYNHNRNVSTELLYDEITTQLQKYEGKVIVSHIKNPVNPKRIDKTANFQFFIDGVTVGIANKYY